jgi:DNA-binding CsgD family transcriptional regulator
VKTVEANLTRTYAKLNVRSRAELSARLAGGPVSPTNS